MMPLAATLSSCGEYLEFALMRIDKWLWVARFYKTRSLAAEAVERDRVQVNGQSIKPARELHVGDEVRLRQDVSGVRTVHVRGLSMVRGPAPVAQALYEETAESLATRARLAEQRRLAPEPAAAQTEGRPTKRDRRAWERWSASIDEP
jgi:ribosome-associated heat shock protein Hsp15